MNDADRETFSLAVTPFMECGPPQATQPAVGVLSESDGSPSAAGLLGPIGNALTVEQRFTIFEPVGAGGFATVFRAQDNVLGRIVALKLPHLPLSLLPESWRRRFVTEVRASAALHHPNIVTVFDAGMDERRCYFVCEYIAGRTLAKWLHDYSQPIAPMMAAEIVAQLADGVQQAHEAHILHRDLKPSNILIDEAKPRGGLPFTPRVTDFGMAQFREVDATITLDGTVLGSPAYMSPEQTLGQIARLGPATDVYSLGVILYELLTRRTPLNAASSAALLQVVVNDEPASPRQLRADLPHDLEAICLKCLEKEPARRYSTAHELALDLHRFLVGDPVAVRSPSVVERAGRWIKRHPMSFSLMATVVVSAVVVVTLFVGHIQAVATLNSDLTTSNDRLATSNQKLRSALQDSQVATQRAEAEERHALETMYSYDIGRAYEAWKKWDAQELHALVARYDETPAGLVSSAGLSSASLRGPEWYWLKRQFQRDSREITQMPQAVYRMAIAPNGKQLVVAGLDDVLRVVELATGQTLAEWPAGQLEVNGLAFSLDGQTLWSTGDDGTLKRWDFATHAESLRIDAHPGHHVYEVLYDAPRELLITCGNEPTIRLWDARTCEPRGTLEGHTGSIDTIVLHSDGRRLFSGSTDHTVRVWDLETRTGDTLRGRMPEKVFALALSLDGRFLAAGMVFGHLLVWDLERNVPRMEWKLKDTIDRVRFDASGRRVFVVDANGVTWEWPVPAPGESPNESPPAHLWQNTGIKPYDVQLSPDGQELLMARRDGRVHAFPLSPPATDDFELRFSRVRDFACLKDGRIAVAEDRQLILVDPKATAQQRQVLNDSGPWPWIAASPDGSLLSAKNVDGGVAVWRLSDGQRVFKRAGAAPDKYHEMSFSADARWLALANEAAGRLEIVDTQTGELTRQFESRSCVHALFSPSGDVLAFDALVDPPGIGRELRLIDWPSQKLRAKVPSRSVYTGTQVFSPDGRWLAVSADRTVQLYDARTGQLIHELFGHRGDIRDVNFSPDSRRLVTAGGDACVKLWHVSTGQHLLEFSCSSSQSPATGTQFTADGCWLVFTTAEQMMHFICLK